MNPPQKYATFSYTILDIFTNKIQIANFTGTLKRQYSHFTGNVPLKYLMLLR